MLWILLLHPSMTKEHHVAATFHDIRGVLCGRVVTLEDTGEPLPQTPGVRNDEVLLCDGAVSVLLFGECYKVLDGFAGGLHLFRE